jgi:hypothetical protein
MAKKDIAVGARCEKVRRNMPPRFTDREVKEEPKKMPRAALVEGAWRPRSERRYHDRYLYSQVIS